MLKAASILSIPVVVTTQNRARLGDTVSELKPLLEKAAVDADKTRFSMWVPAVFSSSATTLQPTAGGPPSQVAIVGIESHICVTQTALDLLAAGHAVYVLADGVSSCNAEEVPIALARLRQAGATVTTSESWLYECMGDAKIDEFKAVVGLVKETAESTKAALGALAGKL